MDNYKYFLPLGSVVKIKGKKTPVLIIQEHSSKTDYLGIDHPFGFENEKAISEFNIADIEEVYFIGYQNKEINKQIHINNIEKIWEEAKNDKSRIN